MPCTLTSICINKAWTPQRRPERPCSRWVGVFAELERAVIRERVMAGLARAKAPGTTLGRKRTVRSVERKIEHAVSRGDRGIRKSVRKSESGPRRFSA